MFLTIAKPKTQNKQIRIVQNEEVSGGGPEVRASVDR